MPLEGEYGPGTSAWARKQAEAFEASGGSKSGTLRGEPIVVLTTVGAVTGKLRKTALMRVEHDGRYAVVGSKGGAANHPRWFFNVLKNPHVELQDGATRRDYRAHVASCAERATWWDRAVKVWPDYAAYQRRTSREIPVIVLEPMS